MANTWNQSGTTWGQNSYGLQTEVPVPITGLSTTSTVGSVSAFNETCHLMPKNSRITTE